MLIGTCANVDIVSVNELEVGVSPNDWREVDDGVISVRATCFSVVYSGTNVDDKIAEVDSCVICVESYGRGNDGLVTVPLRVNVDKLFERSSIVDMSSVNAVVDGL